MTEQGVLPHARYDGRNRPGRQHIFVVNSDPDFLDLLRSFLQEERYGVTTTSFVPHTFDEIITRRPQLLIINLAVRESSGLDLVDRLRRESLTRHIPIIVTSTDSRLLDEARGQGERFGTMSYMGLPFDLDTMLDTIRTLIGPVDSENDRSSLTER